MHNATPFCKKCGSQEVQVFSKNRNEYCKVCFLNILKHKFRATLGKSKSICPNDSILVAHSGKANSTALLHLIMVDTNESISKKLRPSFKVLYIDGMYSYYFKYSTILLLDLKKKKKTKHMLFILYFISFILCIQMVW